MKRIVVLAVSGLFFNFAGCGTSAPQGDIAHDLTTPEGAVLCLEDAYRARDIEAAVRCKDFTIEATLMLEKLQQDFSRDQEILAKTAEVLELGFRSEMEQSGFPDFEGIESSFSGKQSYQGRDDMVTLTETCRHSSGAATSNQLVVAKTADGWKVISVVE